jgi:glycyl-tRNA synthetase beta chain
MAKAKKKTAQKGSARQAPADLLLEIGSEEIPAGFVPGALRQLAEGLAKALATARVSHGEIGALGTPRRLCVFARGVAPRQPDAKSEALGPAVQAAFDGDGKPTPAALGFARSQGVTVEQLSRVQTPKGERLAVEKLVTGQPTATLLPALLEGLVRELKWKKSMRWGDETVTFARPMQWLCAIYAGKGVPLCYGDVKSGTVTFGHRFHAPGKIALSGSPDEYVKKLRAAKVLVDPAERRAEIEKQLAEAARKGGGTVRPDPELVEQVTFLVEWPLAIAGEFEAANLELPPEVVISEMRNHQRYFAVVDGAGKLTHRFVAVSGTAVKDPKVVRHGYERVLRARLADARFFFEEDRKRKLEDRVKDLDRRTYQAKLGTEGKRAERLGGIARTIAQQLGRYEELRPRVDTAARLAKADLSTGMVGEFPELQGIMGRTYALLEGLPEEIAFAIEDHYKPVGASEEMPRSDVGAIVGLADRLHALCGITAIGEKATGAADPFGLRRAALGIIRIVLARGWHLSLSQAVRDTIDSLKGTVELDAKKTEAAVLDFLRGRLRALWADGSDADLVEAVLSAGFDDVLDAKARLAALAEIKTRPDFVPLAVAFKRVQNIQDKAPQGVAVVVDLGLLKEEAERALNTKLDEVASKVRGARDRHDHPAALKAVAELKPAVDRFFDDVLVMAEDAGLRQNRLALMKRVGDLFQGIADFRKIQADGNI